MHKITTLKYKYFYNFIRYFVYRFNFMFAQME